MEQATSIQLADRLDENLNEAEREQLVEQFINHLATDNLSPRDQEVDIYLIDIIIGMMSNVNPEWKNLPVIERIWTTRAVEHMKNTLRNQKRDKCKPLIAKVRTRKKQLAGDQSANGPYDEEDDVSQVPTKSVKKIVGQKRSANKRSQDQSVDDDANQIRDRPPPPHATQKPPAQPMQ